MSLVTHSFLSPMYRILPFVIVIIHIYLARFSELLLFCILLALSASTSDIDPSSSPSLETPHPIIYTSLFSFCFKAITYSLVTISAGQTLLPDRNAGSKNWNAYLSNILLRRFFEETRRGEDDRGESGWYFGACSCRYGRGESGWW
jgi:hypothetical protein